MLKVFECPQYSEEWYKIHCGVPTSSEFDNIITSKGEPSKQREKYLYRLAGERIAKRSEATYQSEAMLRGKELEDEARKYYSFAKGIKVTQVGFCLQEKPGYGCSPDGICGKDGLLEIKSPLISTHIKYLINNRLPVEYFVQTQGQLLVTGKKWVDFTSYCMGIRTLIIRVKPDKVFQVKLKKELEKFCLDLDKLTRRLR
jgi:hypothetical protein